MPLAAGAAGTAAAAAAVGGGAASIKSRKTLQFQEYNDVHDDGL